MTSNKDDVAGTGMGGNGLVGDPLPSGITSNDTSPTGGNGEIAFRHNVNAASNAPEPGSLALLAPVAFVGIAARRRRLRSAHM